MLTGKYSKNKVTTCEKNLIKILSNNDNSKSKTRNNNNNNNNNLYNNNILITDIAFNISEIGNDNNLIYKYIEKKLKYMIKETIKNVVYQIELISDYEKKDLNSKIGLKLTLIEKESLEEILNDVINLYSKSFYEIKLKYNNNNNNNNNFTTRNFCTHLSTI